MDGTVPAAESASDSYGVDAHVAALIEAGRRAEATGGFVRGEAEAVAAAAAALARAVAKSDAAKARVGSGPGLVAMNQIACVAASRLRGDGGLAAAARATELDAAAAPLLPAPDAEVLRAADKLLRLVRNLCAASAANQAAVRASGVVTASALPQALLSGTYVEADGPAGAVWTDSVRTARAAALQAWGNLVVGNEAGQAAVWEVAFPGVLHAVLHAPSPSDAQLAAAAMVLYNCVCAGTAGSTARITALASSSKVLPELLLRALSVAERSPDVLHWCMLLAGKLLATPAALRACFRMLTGLGGDEVSGGGHGARELLLFIDLLHATLEDGDADDWSAANAAAGELTSQLQHYASRAPDWDAAAARGERAVALTTLEAQGAGRLASLLADVLSKDESAELRASLQPALLESIAALLRTSSVARGDAVPKAGRAGGDAVGVGADALDNTALLRLLCNAVTGSPALQCAAHEAGLTPLVLNCCKVDARWPMAREWALVATRHLCEGSEEVRTEVAALRAQAVVDTPELRALNVRAELDGEGKVKVQRTPGAAGGAGGAHGAGGAGGAPGTESTKPASG